MYINCKTSKNMTIKHAEGKDINNIAELERVAFPPSDAASYERMAERVKTYPDFIWLLYEGDKLISFVIALATDERELSDNMYADASLHNPLGDWLMLLSVATHPDFEGNGYGKKVMEAAINESKGRHKGMVLTCKEHNIGFYEKLGFVNEGLSASEHGGAVWYQMRLSGL